MAGRLLLFRFVTGVDNHCSVEIATLASGEHDVQGIDRGRIEWIGRGGWTDGGQTDEEKFTRVYTVFGTIE